MGLAKEYVPKVGDVGTNFKICLNTFIAVLGAIN
jgi:hypothetical protein